jgi:hypothetical protein
MHGLGDSADGFFDVAQMFATQMPHIKVLEIYYFKNNN